MAPSEIHDLEQQRFRVLGEMASLADLRPGRLTCRFQRCGKPNCRCQQEGHPGHGPYYVLHFQSEGKPTTRSIPPDWVERTESQIQNYQRLRELHRELISVSARLCEARLKAHRAGVPTGSGKKKPARRRSSRSSRPSSTGS